MISFHAAAAPFAAYPPEAIAMPTLHEDLIEREVDDLAPLFEGDAASGDAALAATWDACLSEGNIYRIVGTAILWCDLPTIAGRRTTT